MKTFKRRKYGSEIWKIIAKFGCPPRFIAMVRQFHDGMQAREQNDGEFSEPFKVTNGVKQVCVMAPTLCHDKKCTFAVCGVWIICLISFKCLVEHNRYLETLTQE